MMQNLVWQQVIEQSADPARAEKFLKLYLEQPTLAWLQSVPQTQALILATLLGGSQALGELLLTHTEWLTPSLFEADVLIYPRQKQGMQQQVQSLLKPLIAEKNYVEALNKLRNFKHLEMLRIALRDLNRKGNALEIIREISHTADVCLEGVCEILLAQFMEKYGKPFHQLADGDWQNTRFCVIGLGKLGGQELNYSSDIDVIFIYDDEGSVFKEDPSINPSARKSLSNHAFFTRLGEAIISEVSRMTADGMLFRIDLRLRPEGNAGPLVRSLESYENYYAQWGQTWERMMLIKARGVAGNSNLAGEFLEMIHSFRFPRSVGERTLREIAAMKQRIEKEVVKADALDRNVKLGRGGIREIEFLVQTMQLLHAGRCPFLQESQTIPALNKMAQYGLLQERDVKALSEAYCFLRDVEHRLQMEANQQTHTIPTDPAAKRRLARLMGYLTEDEFNEILAQHTQKVRQMYDTLLTSESESASAALPHQFEGAEEEWKSLLTICSFREPDKAMRLLESFVQGPGYVHISSRTVGIAFELITRMLALCPKKALEGPKKLSQGVQQLIESWSAIQPPNQKALSDPDRVLARFDSFIAAYGARPTLFELWSSNPSLFDLLVLLFDRSEFLAELAIRVPDLVDDLEMSGRLRRSKSSAEIYRELQMGIEDEDQRIWMRRYHQTEFMRIGLRDILGLADYEQNLVELTALADACLQHAMDVVLRENRLDVPPFTIIGLGKLGGMELTYGSDLDLIFVADPKVKNLSPLQKMAVRIMDLLSAKTEYGIAFATDARLRPDGEKGLLVTDLETFEQYYRQRAMLWEIQTLSRSRVIAGNAEIGQRFNKMAAQLTNFKNPSLPLSAYNSGWKSEIARMRQRIEKDRVSAGKQPLAFKTGTGGLIDAEFIAQTLCLENGWHEPNTLKALKKAEDEKTLVGCDLLIENFRKLRRIECILRRWSYVGESELPDDPAPQYRVAIRCGFASAAALLQAVAEYRDAIRTVYTKYFNPPT